MEQSASNPESKGFMETILTAPGASSDWKMYRLVRESAMKIAAVVPHAAGPKVIGNVATTVVHRRVIDQHVWRTASRGDRARWYRQMLIAALGLVEWMCGEITSGAAA